MDAQCRVAERAFEGAPSEEHATQLIATRARVEPCVRALLETAVRTERVAAARAKLLPRAERGEGGLLASLVARLVRELCEAWTAPVSDDDLAAFLVRAEDRRRGTA